MSKEQEKQVFEVNIVPEQDDVIDYFKEDTTPVEEEKGESFSLDSSNEGDYLDELIEANKPKAEEVVEKKEVKKGNEILDNVEEILQPEPVEETPVDEASYRKEIFKVMAKDFVEKGLWSNVEGGIENLDLDDESFVELTTQQNIHAAQEIASTYIEEIQQTNEIMDGIIRHYKSGGNMDEILDLFKERQTVLAQNWDTPEGKIAGIKKYYKDFHSWEDKNINKWIKTLELGEDGELDEEADTVKAKLTEHFKKEQELITEREAESKRQEEKLRKVKISNSYDILKSQGVSDKESQTLLDSIFRPRYKGEDGSLLTQVDAEILKIKENEKEYLEFAQFVLNKEKYKKSLATQVKNETTSSIFQTIKNPVKKAADTILPEKKTTFKKDNPSYEEYAKLGKLSFIK